VQTIKLLLIFDISQEGNNYKAFLLSPMQSKKSLPADSVNITNNQISLFFKAINGSYIGNYAGDSISGIFSQNGMNLPLRLQRTSDSEPVMNRPQNPKPPFQYDIEEVSFKNNQQGNSLAGTLTTPKHLKNFPVVVMITGSGTQDRDETLLGHKPFWVIADYFANNGIGALRIDDRGAGESEKGKDDPTSADFATDINTAVGFLKSKGYENIGLVGHSEGGMIGQIVASENKDVKFFVSMAGPGIPCAELMGLQVEAIMKTAGVEASKREKDKTEALSLYNFIKNYKGNNLTTDLKAKYYSMTSEEELKKISNKDSLDKVLNAQVETLSSNWFLYFLKYDPAQFVRKIKIPVLAINGSMDTQVTPKENLEGWRTLLKKSGTKNYEVKELEGLNHLFQHSKTGNPSEYGGIEETFAPEALEIMKNWILKIKK